jgi:putative addiction module killer protein
MQVEKTREYQQWIDSLRDSVGRSRISARVQRLIEGHPGEHRFLTEGVAELKMDFGPGYRVYYSRFGRDLLVLLVGGDKSTQSRDIQIALRLSHNYRE